ncbi:Protein of unknown function [Paenibacillus sp. UNCCL117]|uniref:DUF1835 domain-containing protein n=1 Tax=unclassified Paenibacillus TaxID=185978 RepID=UPI0008813FEC|nr:MULTISPECIES: DUF1835 domain-containing protein [unclassified Paenibacillus]SDD37897.1 Protein of unknown function [Paenibacillus sp. cl123]SFW48699.1 Protein of unknown function [Paenibacillus sp. UNCCL117]
MEWKDIVAIKKATDSLEDGELKPYLRWMLAQIKLMKEQEGTLEAAVSELIELYDALMGLQEKKEVWSPAPTCTHVHIVVGESFAGSMKQALKALGCAETHKLITLRENYAIGPISGLDSPEGRKARSNWFRDHITEAIEAYTTFEEEYKELLDKVEQIPEQAEVMVWTGGNACEQTGMRHALYLLRNKTNSISVNDACAMCEELYNRPDAFITYRHSGEIPSDKLQEAVTRLEGKGKLDAAAIARLVREWRMMTEQTGTLRIWQDGAVLEVPAPYYDRYLLEKLDELKPPGGDNGFLKSARLIGEAMGYCEQYIGDSYFEYRLRELIYDGVLEIKGVPAGMRYYSVRRKQGTGKTDFRPLVDEPAGR